MREIEELIHKAFGGRAVMVHMLMDYARGKLSREEVIGRLEEEVTRELPFCSKCGCLIIFPVKKGERGRCVECGDKVKVRWRRL